MPVIARDDARANRIRMELLEAIKHSACQTCRPTAAQGMGGMLLGGRRGTSWKS